MSCVTGTSVCNGDSGGGMFFPLDNHGNTETWYLRGLTSTGVPKHIEVNHESRTVCDASQYIVFTDVAQYLTWIQTYMEKT